MNGAKQATWLFLTLILLATSGWYFAKSPEEVLLDNQILIKTPDMYVADLTVKQFDEQGKLAHQIKTPGLFHIPQDDRYQIRTPDVFVFHQHNDIWHIQSQKASLIQGGETITFDDNVVISQMTALSQAAVSVMKTESLTYLPKTKKALTSRFVSFEQAGTQIESEGMEAWLAEKKVHLLHKARGHYVPNYS